MSYRLTLTAALTLSLGVAAPVYATDGDAVGDAKASTNTVDSKALNPFFEQSPLPYHFPQFDKIHNEDYKPAFEKGMADNRVEIEAIANNPQPATFDNTIVAMERSGQLLARVTRVFFSQSGTNTNEGMQKIQAEMAPKLAAHSDLIVLNGKLFARVQAVYDQRDKLGLDAESKRLVERYHTDFVRAGAKLSDADKTKLKAINAEMASIGTTFNQNLLKETNAAAIIVDKREQLAGLSDDAIASASEAAKQRNLDGKFVIPLMNTSGQPSLASLKDRALRERIMQASLSRGSHGGEFDNRAAVASMVKLRAERAALLGFANHAAYVLDDETAGSVDAVNKLLAQLAPPAVANARAEAADIQKVIDKEGGKFKVSAGDWAYYTEKVRKEKFDLDSEQLRPYFEMNNVLENGVFFAAHKLYGLTFKERKDLPKYLPDTRIFEVFEENGDPLALFIVDYYARSNKRGGAWANAYVAQSDLFGTKPVIANHLNIPKPPEGEPTLMTYD
ncbi:MAG: M3 family metallopeptidase, partial [Dokdonella sp.]